MAVGSASAPNDTTVHSAAAGQASSGVVGSLKLAHVRFERARKAVSAVVRGKAQAVELALVGVVAGGHLLIEDVPGTGKTTLARALAGALGGTFRRIQFTSDLLPADITGVNVLAADRSTFRFRAGPLFAHVVLADEINRATPKTQSALLEAMAERRVTVDGEQHVLPSPFVVLATQNPHDFHGTFALPDSQLDRFLLCMSIGYPDRDSEREILRSEGLEEASKVQALSAEETMQLCAAVDQVVVHPELEGFLLDLVNRTRSDASLLRGVSPRGAKALYRASRALALARGRAFVIPEDVRELAVPVLAHRVVARAESELTGESARRAIRQILGELSSPV